MKKVNIMLSSIMDVKSFVSIVSKYDFDVDLISGRYVVNAKSILGIFSLDLTKKITLETVGSDAFFEEIKPFIVD